MNLLIDTDVVLDVAINRAPFFEESKKIFRLVESSKVVGFIAWHTVSNLYYLTRASSGVGKTKEFISSLLEIVSIATVGTPEMQSALTYQLADFEDSMQVASAVSCKANYIVTRNVKDFKKSPIPAKAPADIFAMFG